LEISLEVLRGFQAVHVGHGQVQQRHVGQRLQSGQSLQEFLTVGSLPDHLQMSGSVQYRDEALSEKPLVFGDGNANSSLVHTLRSTGIRMIVFSPWPGAVTHSNLAFNWLTRASMFIQPSPARLCNKAGSKPCPSSV